MSTAAAGPTKAQGAVMATRPPSMPLQAMPMSGLRDKYQAVARAAIAPAADESSVLAATMAMRTVASVQGRSGVETEPAKSQDERAHHGHGQIVPGIAAMVSSRRYLPTRGPSTIAPAKAVIPPVICTTDEPAKSTWPCPSPIAPFVQPAAAPRPSCRRADTETWT